MGNGRQIDRFPDFAALGRKLFGLVGRMTGAGGKLTVGVGGIVTNQAIYPCLRGQIETLVTPAVTNVAARTAWPVGCRRDAKVVDHVALAEFLASNRVLESPGPMSRLVELLGGLRVTFEAGFGNLRSGLEWTVQLLKLLMVSSGFVRARRWNRKQE